ncbi:MAG TPA: rod shape-determining protein RodA [Clostridiales bacterium]|nr:rod shape-determining protein RodA [Clostridiales bacterium]
MINFKKYDLKNYNISLIIIVTVLSMIGIFLISIVQKDTERLFEKQILGLVAGLTIAVVVSFIDYRFIGRFFIIFYIINLGLLIAVKLYGKNVYGATRWLDLKYFTFQPSELSKVIMIIFFAKLFTIFKEKLNTFPVVLLSIVTFAIPIYLVLSQPDLSSSLVFVFVFLMMIYVAGLKYKIIIPALLIGIPLFLGLFWYVQQDYQAILSPSQQLRVLSIINPEEYAGTMYQQENSITVIGSGKLTGKLLQEEGTEAILSDTYVPVSESDFIFSVVGEAFGFIGAFLVLLLYVIIIVKCLMVARNSPDYMGMLISSGVACMFMFQVFVNVGVVTAILPNTGLPLPFLSYGLSSLVSSFIAIGLVLNISLQKNKRRR